MHTPTHIDASGIQQNISRYSGKTKRYVKQLDWRRTLILMASIFWKKKTIVFSEDSTPDKHRKTPKICFLNLGATPLVVLLSAKWPKPKSNDRTMSNINQVRIFVGIKENYIRCLGDHHQFHIPTTVPFQPSYEHTLVESEEKP